MSTREITVPRNAGQPADGRNARRRLRQAAVIAIIAALVAVTTTVVIIGGSEPANACLF